MSQWTHVIGIVRFENIEQSMSPTPPTFNPEAKRFIVHEVFSEPASLPHGSEGPLEVQTVITKRGPSVMIIGDLRDFGVEELGEVVGWLNFCLKESIKRTMSQIKLGGFPLGLRDAFIHCDVEANDDIYTIQSIDVGIGKDYHQEFALFKNGRAI